MSIASMLTQTATVTRTAAGTFTSTGAWTAGTQATPTTVDYPCRLEQISAAEVIDQGGRRVVTTWRLFLPPDAVIGVADTVVVDGVAYEVDSQPDILHTPRGPHHIEAQLKLVYE